MTADDAREIMTGSMQNKFVFYKAKLTFICGMLNKYIDSSARIGDSSAGIKSKGDVLAKKYYPLMAKLYEDRGFVVAYNIASREGEYSFFNVYWSVKNLDRADLDTINRCTYHSCVCYRLLDNMSADAIRNAKEQIEMLYNNTWDLKPGDGYSRSFYSHDSKWLHTIAGCLSQIINYMELGQRMDFNTVTKWRVPKDETSGKQ